MVAIDERSAVRWPDLLGGGDQELEQHAVAVLPVRATSDGCCGSRSTCRAFFGGAGDQELEVRPSVENITAAGTAIERSTVVATTSALGSQMAGVLLQLW